MFLAERNRRWALAHGGQEWDPRHYRVIVALHTLFYLSLWLEWRYGSRGWSNLWPLWLGLLAAAQVLRLWAILALGRRWNTRIIVVPQMKLVSRGPYRFIRHPNYLAVIIELIAIPTLCGAYFTAVCFSLANADQCGAVFKNEQTAISAAAYHAGDKVNGQLLLVLKMQTRKE